MNTLINKILCINCGNGLIKNGLSVKCKKCGRAYAFYKGILRMMSDSSLRDEQNSFQKHHYDSHYKTEYANKMFEWRKRYIARLSAFLPRSTNSYVLDLACGQGYLSLVIAKMGYKVIACDISISGLYEARREAERLGIEKNILFVEVDIYKVKFKKNSFDFILLMMVLEHLTDDRAIIKKVISFSKKTALYYIGVPLSLKYVFPLFIPLYLYSDYGVGHKRRYSINQILDLFNHDAQVISLIYTGHLVKFLGLFLEKIGINRFGARIEDSDEKLLSSKLWASNITAVIKKLNRPRK